MEAKLTERLRQYGVLRTTALDFLFKYLPRQSFEQSRVFHSVLILSTILIIIVIFATARRLTLFTLHPVFMSIGTIICLAEGIVSYRNGDLLEFFSPIMQHNKKVKVRAIHQSLMMTGVIFLALGMLFIFAHKIHQSNTIIPLTLHSIFGFVALCLIVVQVISGQDKLAHLENGNRRVRRWHGELGLVVWDLLCLTILLGVLSYLTLLSFGTFLVLLFVAAVWVCVHAQLLGRAVQFKYDTSSVLNDDNDGKPTSVGPMQQQLHSAEPLQSDGFSDLILENDGRKLHDEAC